MQNMRSHQENLTVLAQFEDSKRAAANSWGRLYSLECATDFQPQMFPLALRLWQPLWCEPWPLLFWPSLRLKHVTFSRHPWVTFVWMSRALFTTYPALICNLQIAFLYLKEENNRRWSPGPFSPLWSFSSMTHCWSLCVATHLTMFVEYLLLLEFCDWFLTLPFICLFMDNYWLPTIHQVQVQECTKTKKGSLCP